MKQHKELYNREIKSRIQNTQNTNNNNKINRTRKKKNTTGTKNKITHNTYPNTQHKHKVTAK